MSDHDVFMGTTQAHAYLGTGSTFHTFRFNPDDAHWDYKENTMSYDTIGGRVVQLLSVQISGLTITGRAGSRGELQRLAENVRRIMDYHIKTSQAVTFRVPSRQWDFRVYVQAMPQVGWDVASTSYPYSLQLAVEEDVSGLQSQKLEATALTRLAENIGYKKAFHGGEAAGFQKVVNTLLAATGGNSNQRGGGGGGGGANGNSPPYTGSAVYRGPNDGIISASDTPSLKLIERALKANGMLPPGRTCGTDTVSGSSISEHVGCNAKDNMVNVQSGDAAVTGQERENGDAIASYLVDALKNNTLPIHCVIWYKQVFQRETMSWSAYHGEVPHTDHVHVSGWPSLHGFC